MRGVVSSGDERSSAGAGVDGVDGVVAAAGDAGVDERGESFVDLARRRRDLPSSLPSVALLALSSLDVVDAPSSCDEATSCSLDSANVCAHTK